ncbi:MAG: cysteine desulfurase / selenocysteine lyase [archaeon GW2011_AR3]|nr:MAG: cysteine desulfurase / selenocysteine lyase [archaeon GW2011_AR3]
MLDVTKIRKDFPILGRKINGKSLVYLDNAATSQKPVSVISAIKNYYEKSNSNIHRSIHTLSQEATESYEGARKKTAKHVNWEEEATIFTRNTTESLNLVMRAWGMKNIRKGDEIVLTEMEHHSNLVPWQFLAKSRGAQLKFLSVDAKTGKIKTDEFHNKITGKTKLVSVCHMSNVLGTINPVDEIANIAHENGAIFVLDAAQSVPHFPFNGKQHDFDFVAFSGHKMLGPMGIGVLLGKKDILEEMDPFLFGGDMIARVELEKTEYDTIPGKLEAGTPNVAGAAGLGAAVDYLNKIGMGNVKSHCDSLTKYALEKLSEINQLTLYGPKDTKMRGSVISFSLGDVHPHDLSTLLDRDGVAVRGGHHCAMPLTKVLGVTATTRASLYLYNTKEEIDQLALSLKKASEVFKLDR